MKRIKVIQVIDRLQTGGTEKIALNIANHLARDKYESYLCTTRAKGSMSYLLKDDVYQLHLKKKYTLDLRTMRRFSSFLKEHKIEIIHAHSTSLFFSVLAKLFYQRVKIIWHNHHGNTMKYNFIKLMHLKILSLFIDKIITVNKELKDWLESKLYCRKVVLLNNFAFLDKELPATYLKGVEGKRILCLASFRPMKDHFNLLRAFKILNDADKDVSLHLVGDHFNDSYYKSVVLQIDKLHLSNCVYFYGMIKDVSHVIKQSTIGVLSSFFEGLPISILEYGISGLPIVSTNVGGIDKVVFDSRFLVPPNEPKSLAKSLELLIKNTEVRKEYSKKLKEHVETNYGMDSYLTSLGDIYEF